MSKLFTVGSCTFLFPEQGQKSGWGEIITDWACSVSARLGSISGANDIDLTTVCICNNKSSVTDVGTGSAALSFSTSAVRSFEVNYVVIRGSNSESGSMNGNYTGAAWNFSHDFTGCSGMCFTITSAGQVQYTSTNACIGTMKFIAKTIAQ